MSDFQVTQLLLEQLREPSPEEQQQALDRLSDLAPEGAVEMIAPLLDDENEDVRIEAMVCLRDLRDPSAIPYLINALETSLSDRTCEYAILSLSGFTGPDVRRCLLNVLIDSSPSNIARMKIVMQMWRYPDDEVIEVLKDIVLHDSDRNVRSHAADSLAFLFRLKGQPLEWASFWEKVAEDKEIGPSSFANDALRRLGIG